MGFSCDEVGREVPQHKLSTDIVLCLDMSEFGAASENPEPIWFPVDGALLEGGGQIMRLALPLATVFRIPVKLHSIRMG